MSEEIRNSKSEIRNALVLVFLFLVPWQTRWILQMGRLQGEIGEYGTLAIYATEILIWAIACTRVVLRFSPRVIFEQFARIVRRWWPVAVGVTYIFLSALWAPAPRVALFGAFHVASALAAFFVVRNSSLGYKKMATAFIGGAVVQALLGIAQVVFQWALPSTFFGMAAHDPQSLGTSVVMHEGVRFLRAYGGLPHPNILGGYLAIALLFTAILVFFETRSRHRIILLMAEAILVLGLFFTFSRSAWLAFFVGFMALLVNFFKKESYHFSRGRDLFDNFRMVLVVLVLVLVMPVWQFRGTVFHRFVGDTQLEETSRIERLSGIYESFAVIKSSPWIGTGIGNYTARLAELAPGKPSWSYQPVHNVPLLMLTELGIFGMMLVFFVILNEVKNLRRMPAEIASARDPSLAFRMTLDTVFILFIIFLLDHYLWSLYPGLFLGAITFGIAYFSVNFKTPTPIPS